MKTHFTTKYNIDRKRVTFIGALFIVLGILSLVASLFFSQAYATILTVLGVILMNLGMLIIAIGIIFFERMTVRPEETEDEV